MIQRQYCELTILSTKEPIFNQLLTQKLFLVHLVKSYLALTGGLVMLEIIKCLNKVFGIRTNFNFSSIGVEVIVVAQLSKWGITLTPLPYWLTKFLFKHSPKCSHLQTSSFNGQWSSMGTNHQMIAKTGRKLLWTALSEVNLSI